MEKKQTDFEEIGQTVQYYFDGLYNCDTTLLRKAFHPEACLFGYMKGQYLYLPLAKWLEIVEGRPSPAKSGEKYDMEIISIDVTRETGVVKVADLVNGLRFTDYLAVVKDGGRWVIVNKIFSHEVG